MPHLLVLPAARRDLIEIGDFIAEDNPSRAVTFVAEIEVTMRKIAERPLMCAARDEIHVGLRSARHGRYLIFFEFDGKANTVGIVRVLHGARDLAKVLSTRT